MLTLTFKWSKIQRKDSQLSHAFFFAIILFSAQIVRGDAVVKARLAQLLTETSSPNPRWLIKFDGLSLRDEEVNENTFSKPSSPYSDNSSSDRESSDRRGHGRRGNSGTSSEGEMGDDHAITYATRNNSSSGNNRNGRRNHRHHSPNQPSDESETGGESAARRAARTSAREARSKRRQAKIDDEAVSGGPPANKRRAPPPNRNNRNKQSRANHSSYNDDAEGVVKVKLLTGTLYLYQGLHRRAEFVHHV